MYCLPQAADLQDAFRIRECSLSLMTYCAAPCRMGPHSMGWHPMMHRDEAMQLHMLSAALPVVLLFALSLLHRAFLICWLTTDVSDVLLLVAALMRCRYCSRDCQAAHWQQHKAVCKRVSAGPTAVGAAAAGIKS
jgi:hypothetical protein